MCWYEAIEHPREGKGDFCCRNESLCFSGLSVVNIGSPVAAQLVLFHIVHSVHIHGAEPAVVLCVSVHPKYACLGTEQRGRPYKEETWCVVSPAELSQEDQSQDPL